MNTLGWLSVYVLLVVCPSQAQLDLSQYSAFQALMKGIGCVAPSCAAANFAANDSCPIEVVCVDGRVSLITITSKSASQVAGSINGAALAVLTGLSHFQLIRFNLTTVPTEIGRLSALTLLYLFASALTGTLPSQIGALTSLTVLDLADNNLGGTLPALNKLTRLTRLELANNVDLGGNMPPMPTSLRALLTENCAFTALPPNLSALTTLTELRAHSNRFVGAPPAFLPSSLTRCSLQLGINDTNCLACPTAALRPCTCIPNSNVTTCGGTIATTTTTSTSTTTTTTTTITKIGVTAPPSSSGLEPWIVGVIIGGVALALIVVGVLVFFNLKKRRQVSPAPIYADVADVQAPAPTYADVVDVRAGGKK
jgi:hypothetical protein